MTAPPLGKEVALAHVALPACDVEESTAFYERIGFVRGFEKSGEDGKLVLRQMRLGDFFLELFPTGDRVSLRPDALDGNHLGLMVASTAEAYRRLVVLGITATPPARGASGVSYLFLRDPSGNWIELTSP